MLGKIAQFFDWELFAKGKEFEVVAVSPDFEYVDKVKTGKILGTKITVCITKDPTNYGEPGFSNAYEKLTFKIKTMPEKVNLVPGTKIIPLVDRCVIYGQYNNQLSISCSSILNAKGEMIV